MNDGNIVPGPVGSHQEVIGGGTVMSGSVYREPTTGGASGGYAPFFRPDEYRALKLGFIIGFCIGFLPFALHGMGFYSLYPIIVGVELGLYLSGLLCSIKLVQHRAWWKLFTVDFLVLLFTHFMPSIPYVALFRRLL